MDSGLAGLVAAETVLSHSDGAQGIMWVRGYTLAELVAQFGYEGAVGLLWEDFAGETLGRETIRARLGAARVDAFAARGQWLDRAGSRPPVEAVRLALASLPDDAEPAAILATVPVAVGALLRQRQGAAPLAPDPALSTAADLLRMAHGQPVDPALAEALDTYWTALIDNGLNTSAFTARVIASSRASLASAALGAYCAFTGPLHGGAPGPTLDLLDEAAASGDVAAWAERKLAAGERLMGFGHRVFKDGDPRALILRDALRRLGARLGPAAGRLAFAAEVEGPSPRRSPSSSPAGGRCSLMSRSMRRCCSTRSACRAMRSCRSLRWRAVPAGSPMRWSSSAKGGWSARPRPISARVQRTPRPSNYSSDQ